MSLIKMQDKRSFIVIPTGLYIKTPQLAGGRLI